jgi:hypothetical protein
MFQDMDPWEIALWAVASYLAVVSLVRLVKFHRRRLVARFREQLLTERRRQQELILKRKQRAAGTHISSDSLTTHRSIRRHG